MDQELIFKALSHSIRRLLLDNLFVKDGQSLSELEVHLAMTRFGVMKHLRILERAGLIVTRKNGRETLHYLNAVPIQLIYDRWMGKYSKEWARSLTELKYDLEAIMEDGHGEDMTKHVFEIYIRTSPARLWQALTDGAITEKYFYGSHVDSSWKVGSPYGYLDADKVALIDGTIIDYRPLEKLAMTFNPHWESDDEKIAHPPSKITYEINQIGEVCKLTLIHDELAADETAESFFHGWSQILSGLKTYLETGEPLVIGGPGV